MIGVSTKFDTLRYALAEGYLYGKRETIARVAQGTVPKGDVLEIACVRGECVIINMPGSSKGALESLQELFPGLLHIFQ
jgi:cyclic pyranopterin monophosphate synthase